LHFLENAAKTDTLARSNWFLMPFSDQAMNTQPCNDCPLNALVATTPAIAPTLGNAEQVPRASRIPAEGGLVESKSSP
jgi:hypothetical protein